MFKKIFLVTLFLTFSAEASECGYVDVCTISGCQKVILCKGNRVTLAPLDQLANQDFFERELERERRVLEGAVNPLLRMLRGGR